MTFALRRANQEDEQAIKRLVRESGINPLGLNWQRFIVAEDSAAEGPRIIGIGQIKPHGDGSRELASIATARDRQGEGVATAIIQSLLATQSGALYLTCRAHNEAFYERFGFHRLTRLEDAPPYFRRIMRLGNALFALGRVFGFKDGGVVMVRKGE